MTRKSDTSPLHIPLDVRRHPADTVHTARHAEPITVGVPLPRGACHDVSGWELADVAAGAVYPAQTQATDRWPDGSIRWLLVDARIDVASESTSLTLRQTAAPPTTAAGPRLTVTSTQGDVTVDSGAARVRITRGGSFPLSAIGDLANNGAGLTVQDSTGASSVATVADVEVVTEGPLRATLRVRGRLPHPGHADLTTEAALDFYAGSPVVRVSVCLRNIRKAEHPGGFWDLGDPGSLLLKDVSLHVPAASGTAGRVACSSERTHPLVDVALPFEIYQDSSGGENWQSTIHINRLRTVPLAFRGYRQRAGGATTEGLRATPIVSVPSNRGHVTLSVPEFWQNFPKAVDVDPAGITWRLFPGQHGDLHELQAGEQKTHVAFVAFGADPTTPIPLDWTRARVLVRPDAAWVMSTGAVRWLAGDDAAHASVVRSAIEGGDTFEQKREVVDQYGWRHFGDVYGDHEAIRHTGPMPLVSHYNNQYDPIAGFLYQYLRGGDGRWWTMAAELAAHVADIDVYHTERDKSAYNGGLFWHTYHYGDADTSTHRTYPRRGAGETGGGGPSPDHNYTTGLLLHYFMTGDLTSRDAVTGLASFVLNTEDGRRTPYRWISTAPTGYATASGSYAYHGPGRGPGNSLNAVVDGHQLTGDRRFLDKAEELIRRVVHPAEDITRHRLDDPENKWFYLMFLQALGKYLAHKADLGELDAAYAYGRDALVHYARWMADHEYPYLEKPERLTFPTETWAAHEIRKSDVFYLAALHATGADRQRFIERGTFFFQYAVRTLPSMPTYTLARPIIVMLSSGLMHPWFQGHAEASAPVVAPPAGGYRPPVPFVPQKQQALARLKLIAAAVAVTITGLVAYALTRLL